MAPHDATVDAKQRLRANGWYVRTTEWPTGHQVVLHRREDTSVHVVTRWWPTEAEALEEALSLAEERAGARAREERGGAPAAPPIREGGHDMSDHPVYPAPSADLARHRRELAPAVEKAFRAFSEAAFDDGALPRKTKQLVAVAVAHTTQCPYCIRGHTLAALREGATEAEIMEAIWVAAEMRAGGAFAHATVALAAMHEHGRPQSDAGAAPAANPEPH